MNVNENIKKHFNNPFLWLAIIGAIFSILKTYNQVEANRAYTITIEKRLQKKIDIIENNSLKIIKLEAGFDLLQKDLTINKLESKLNCNHGRK